MIARFLFLKPIIALLLAILFLSLGFLNLSDKKKKDAMNRYSSEFESLSFLLSKDRLNEEKAWLCRQIVKNDELPPSIGFFKLSKRLKKNRAYEYYSVRKVNLEDNILSHGVWMTISSFEKGGKVKLFEVRSKMETDEWLTLLSTALESPKDLILKIIQDPNIIRTHYTGIFDDYSASSFKIIIDSDQTMSCNVIKDSKDVNDLIQYK